MKPGRGVWKRGGKLEALVEELRRLLLTPGGANDAWDCFHDGLMRQRAFMRGAEACTHPALVEAVEAALEGLTRQRFPLEDVVLASVQKFGLVHGAGVAGDHLVLIVFCEKTRRGLIGIPLRRSGQLLLLHVAVADGPPPPSSDSFPMTPANC